MERRSRLATSDARNVPLKLLETERIHREHVSQHFQVTITYLRQINTRHDKPQTVKHQTRQTCLSDMLCLMFTMSRVCHAFCQSIQGWLQYHFQGQITFEHLKCCLACIFVTGGDIFFNSVCVYDYLKNIHKEDPRFSYTSERVSKTCSR